VYIEAGSGTVCATGTCLAGVKPYCDFFPEKYHAAVLHDQYGSQFM